MLQYLPLRKGGQAEARAEKQVTSPESSQIDAIQIQRKKHKFINSSLKMQEGPKGLLKILKGHRDLQGPALKAGRDNLNNFKSNSEPLKNLLKSFKDASEGEVKPRDPNEYLNEDQLEAKWA